MLSLDFFGWAALPGIVLKHLLLCRYPQHCGLYETLSVTMNLQNITIVLSWGGYCVLFRQNNVSRRRPPVALNEYSGRYFVLQHCFWSFNSLPLLLVHSKASLMGG